MHRSSLVLIAALLGTPFGTAAADAPPSAQGAPVQRAQFAYHSAFLMNLHHFLFNLAVHPSELAPLLQKTRATPREAAVLRMAVAFYRTNYAQRDLLFDETMAVIKRALSVQDERRDPSGLALPDGLPAVLKAAGPAYARLAWTLDDAANRAWIAEAQRLDARYGAAVQAAVEHGLGAGFPRAPVRIDVVRETGKRQGAYTDTQVVIPAGRPSYQGLASLEMLYHEAAHVQSADALEAAIAARLKAAGKPTDSELWHVLHFYTVGAAVAAAVKPDGVAYEPYADRVGLFKSYWAAYVPLIEADWAPWLAGREGMEDALDHMVQRLPEGL